jgi:hypothetical protein
MSVQVFWDNDEKTIIRQLYEGVIRLEDYYATIDKVSEMIRSVDYTVHTIYQRERVTAQPSTMISVLRYGHRRLPPNLGINVIIGANQVTRVIVNIGKSIAPNLAKNVCFADTVEEAHTLIQQQAKSISTEAKA